MAASSQRINGEESSSQPNPQPEEITVQYGYIVKRQGVHRNHEYRTKYGNWDIATRAQILALKAFGHKNEEIAEKLGFKKTGQSLSTVYNIWKRAKERGFDPENPVVLDIHVKDAPRSGRPRKPREGRDRCRCKRILCQRCLEDRAARVPKRPRAKKGSKKGKDKESQETNASSSMQVDETMRMEDVDADGDDDGAPIPDDQLPVVPQDDVERLLQIYQSVSVPIHQNGSFPGQGYSGPYVHVP